MSGPGGGGPELTGAERGRRDLVDGLLWAVLGAAILIGSWRMDRLEAQRINPYTVPGLVPGLLGLAMVLLAATMLVRGWRGGGAAPRVALDGKRPGLRETYGRVATVIALCLAFAVGLLGRGPPFWAAAALFVTAAIFVLRYREFREKGRLGRGFATSAAIGLGAGAIVTLVFERFFFVRLP